MGRKNGHKAQARQQARRRPKRERVVAAEKAEWEGVNRQLERSAREIRSVQAVPRSRLVRGQLVWAWVPYYEDRTQGKSRPALILRDDPQTGDIEITLLSTYAVGDNGPGEGTRTDRYRLDDWVDLGLTRPSAVTRRRVVVPPEDVRTLLGRLPEKRVADIEYWIGSAFTER